MFDRLAAIVMRRWMWVLAGWFLLAALAPMLAPRWDDVSHDGDLAYLPKDAKSSQGQRLLEAAFPDVASKSEIIVIVARPDGALKKRDYAVADRLVERLTPNDGQSPVVEVRSHRTNVLGKKLVSAAGPHGQALLILLRLPTEFMAVANVDLTTHVGEILAAERRAADFPPGLELGITGSAALGSDTLQSALESVRNTERITVLLVLAILLLVYRAPGLVVVPLIVLFASLAVILGLLTSLAALSEQLGWFEFMLFKLTRILIVVILFGAGTDFCLFLIARYKEELNAGHSATEAIRRSLGQVGHVIAASALTTILGLGMMAFAEFGKARNGGLTIALCLAVALVASVTLAPALLRAAGLAVFWPFGPGRRGSAGGEAPPADLPTTGASASRGFWDALSRRIIAHPGLILAGSLLLLAPLAYRGVNVRASYDVPSGLQPQRPSVKGLQLFRRYFSAGQMGPITVMAYRKQGEPVGGEALVQHLLGLSKDLYQLKFVEAEGAVVRPITEVYNLAEPLGRSTTKQGLRSVMRDSLVRAHPMVKRAFLAQAPEYAGRLTRLDIVTRYDPFSPEATRVLDQLDEHLSRLSGDPSSAWDGVEFYFAGPTAAIRDLQAVTDRDLLKMQILVPLAVLAVLIAVLRRPIVSIYLVLTVLLGYYVSLGATDLLFGWFYGDAFKGLDWQVPVFVFVILVAVGEDYNIYLVTRIQEEQARRGPIEGLRVALIRTGGIITSCGVIMAGTFASMIAGSLPMVQQLGVAFSLGILLDTFVIRTILVPAFLALWDSVVPPRAPQRPCAGSSDNDGPQLSAGSTASRLSVLP